MIHNKLLKATVDIITEPLTILFNRCLNEGIFPNIWKIAHVTPLHKKGPKNLCNNYRPISLLSGVIVQELCESRGGRPGLSVLTSLLVSVDVKIYCTVLRHWSQLVPNMSHDI